MGRLTYVVKRYSIPLIDYDNYNVEIFLSIKAILKFSNKCSY